MIFTQISCAGKDIQEVWLDGRLVWQYSKDLLMYGDADIKHTATAVFNLTVNEYMAGRYEHRVNESVSVKLVRSVSSAGNSIFETDSMGASKLMKALILAASHTVITTAEGGAHPLPVKDMSVYEDVFCQTEKGNIIDIKAVIANVAEHAEVTDSGIVNRITAMDSTASYMMEHVESATGWAIYVQKVNGKEHTDHSTSSTMISLEPNKANTGIELKLLSAADGRVFPAELIGADSKLSKLAVAFARLSDVLGIAGKIYISTHSIGNAVVNDAQLTAGRVAESPHSTAYSKRLKALASNGIGRHYTENTAVSTLWWFPVGDGTVLEQDSDIKKNGDVLEIQWAFDTVFHENGILEVI